MMRPAPAYAPLTGALIRRMGKPTPLMERAFSIPMSLLVETLILPQRAR
jgi:hypothetical protein